LLKIFTWKYQEMKFPGGFDLNAMMKQAQQMQEQMGREMKQTIVEASAGGGAVSVKMRGDFEVVELKISPDLVKEGDVEMIQDLAVAALNEAHRKVEETLKGKLGGMLPPGLI
jgi:DNA-binding YbaB/EbfC family protein